MLSKIFIDRPRFAVVISLVISISGFMALLRLPVAQFPDIVPPQVQVSAYYPGASAAAVESSVAQNIETAVNGVERMLYFSSQSSNNGQYSLSITFEVGTDPDLNMVNVQNRLKRAEPLLPEEVTRQGVNVESRTSSFLKAFMFYSPDDSIEPLELSDWVYNNIVDVMTRIPGVGGVNFFGATYSMRVWLDPVKMAGYGLTPAEVSSVLAAQNIQAAVGEVGGAPTLPEQELHFNVTAQGRLSSPSQFSEIILRTGPDGGILRLGDVARVELDTESYSPMGTYKGRQAAGMMLTQQSGSNAVQTANEVSRAMEELGRRMPDGISYLEVFDATRFVRASIEEVAKAIGIAMVLVILVVYLFLGSWRSTLIPMFAVPVSLVGAFAVLAALGYSANTVSLLALVLAVGIVVDDAIVVVENIERVMREENLPPKEAAYKAMGQITGALIAIALVLLSVFVPVAFIPGLSGKLYQQFAVTISAAMLISCFNALTLSPALCAVFMRREEGEPNWIVRRFQGLVVRSRDSYHGLVTMLLRRSAFGLVVAAFCLAASYGILKFTPSGFLPTEDMGMVVVQVGLPEGSSLNKTREVLQKASAIAEGIPGVQNLMAVVGVNIVNFSMQDNAAFMFVGLAPYEERETADLSSDAVQMQLNMRLASIVEANCQAFSMPPIVGLDSVGGFQFILLDYAGREPQELSRQANSFIARAMQEPGLMMAMTFFNTDTPVMELRLDRDKALALGVGVDQIFGALQQYLGSYYVNDFNFQGRSWKVMVMSDYDGRRNAADLESMHVKSASGAMVPLSAVLEARMTTGPQNITRYNNSRSVTVMGSTYPGLGTGVGISAMENAARTLPPDMGFEWTGSTYQERESAGQTVYLFILSFTFAYLFLVALYESWTIPLGVIISVSAAIYGAMMAVKLTGFSMGLYVQIGIVTLIALASKNAILIVEFAKEARAGGATIKDSAASGSFLRFRAVVMTSLAFLAGLLPLVFATGPGAASRQNVSTAVFGGMIASCTVGLIIIPLVYAMFQKMREFFHSLVGSELYARPERRPTLDEALRMGPGLGSPEPGGPGSDGPDSGGPGSGGPDSGGPGSGGPSRGKG
ncbi:MAG: efflux RND transporter permease subunit [Deltaproteobacteria bacterium]|jgi:HAE1 family hydrophobic/amphiphilic exporter-1|nr:efflux RND transporter permease subunit [Deltaproteobacteria bacterium]